MDSYAWSFETSIEGASNLAAEDWLREVWEQGPRFLRVFLPLAWKYGLGLRLGPTSDTTRILGWHIAGSSPNVVTVEADSPLMRAENSVTVDEQRIQWNTVVTHKNLIGRVLWMPAQVIHQWLIPQSLRRAVRDQQA